MASVLPFAPNGHKPGLPVAREPRWPEVALHLGEASIGDVFAPGVGIVEAAIAFIAKPFVIISSRV